MWFDWWARRQDRKEDQWQSIHWLLTALPVSLDFSPYISAYTCKRASSQLQSAISKFAWDWFEIHGTSHFFCRSCVLVGYTYIAFQCMAPVSTEVLLLSKSTWDGKSKHLSLQKLTFPIFSSPQKDWFTSSENCSLQFHTFKVTNIMRVMFK